MKALSVRQPHCERIALGKKRVEYRTWQVAYRGPLLIVASKVPDIEACEERGFDPRKLAHGAMICVVELVDVTGEPGDFEWQLRNPRRVWPTKVRGFAALYTVPDEKIVFV